MAVGQPEGPQGPEEKVSVSWLILQRLDDIRAKLGEHDRRFDAVDRRFESMERRWTWSLGILLGLVAGVLAKLLIPSA